MFYRHIPVILRTCYFMLVTWSRGHACSCGYMYICLQNQIVDWLL